MELDRVDLRILSALQKNARITNQSLAETINLSPSSCLQRVRRLEKEGVLKDYHAHVDLDTICRHIVCIATVAMRNHSVEDTHKFEQLVDNTPEVVECLTVSGEFDYVLRIICPDMKRYVEVNDALVSAVSYAIQINTHVVMKENKRNKGVNFDTLLRAN